MYSIEGKTAVVTGSTRGIGKAIASRLADEGANLVINYRKREEEAEKTLRELERKGVRVFAVKADLSSIEGCRTVIDKAVEEFKTIDILVNNAGVGFYRRFRDVDEKLIQKTIDVDFKSAIYCSLFASRSMHEGVIINMSSITGILPSEGLSIYSSVKGGIIAFTKSLAIELSPKIRVNAIAPGLVATDLGDSLLGITGADPDTWLSNHTLTHTLTVPEEIAEATLSAIKIPTMTGQVIVIDGGQSLIAGRAREKS